MYYNLSIFFIRQLILSESSCYSYPNHDEFHRSLFKRQLQLPNVIIIFQKTTTTSNNPKNNQQHVFHTWFSHLLYISPKPPKRLQRSARAIQQLARHLRLMNRGRGQCKLALANPERPLHGYAPIDQRDRVGLRAASRNPGLAVNGRTPRGKDDDDDRNPRFRKSRPRYLDRLGAQPSALVARLSLIGAVGIMMMCAHVWCGVWC